MKNLPLALALVLLAAIAAALWRIDSRLAPLTELARAQLADREDARQAELARREASARAEQEAHTQAQAAAARQAAETAAAAELALAEATRRARHTAPVKPGETVPFIQLDNREIVRNAVVVAVQPTSVSFRVGTQLYNIPAEQLPEDLRARLSRMFPPVPAATAPASDGP